MVYCNVGYCSIFGRLFVWNYYITFNLTIYI